MLRPAALAILCFAGLVRAQTTYELRNDATPAPVRQTAEYNEDEAVVTEARRLIAAGRTGAAKDLLTRWLKAGNRKNNPWLPDALLARGDARLARNDEFKSLYDYEKVLKDHTASDAFTKALEREYDVASLYLNGRRKKVFGMRLDSGVPTAEEIIIRINERLPGSNLAERSLLELADYYYRVRDLTMAAETYDVFLALYPRSAMRARAQQRRIYATIAQFKGPRHDASGLIEARYQIEDFQRDFPVEAQRLGMSDALQARLDESAAEQLLTVARWYMKRDDGPSARLTLVRLIRKHPGTGAAREGYQLMERKGWAMPGAEPVATPADAPPTDLPDAATP